MTAITSKTSAAALLLALSAVFAMPAQAGDCPPDAKAATSASKSQLQKPSPDEARIWREMYGGN